MDDGIRNAWMNETPESMISSSFDHSSSSWMLSCSGFPWIFQKGGTDIGTPFKTSTDYSKYCFNRWSKMESFYTNFSVKHWWGSEGAEVSGQYLKGRHGVNSSAETFFCHIRSFVRSFIFFFFFFFFFFFCFLSFFCFCVFPSVVDWGFCRGEGLS